jgi:hypothetical protein
MVNAVVNITMKEGIRAGIDFLVHSSNYCLEFGQPLMDYYSHNNILTIKVSE